MVEKSLLVDWWIAVGGWTCGIAWVYYHVGGGGTQGLGWEGDGLVNGTVQRPMLLLDGPERMVWFPRLTLTWSSIKFTYHPWSHICLTDRRDPDFKSRNICERRAYSGKFGREIISACVDLIRLPYGSATENGYLVTFLFVHTLVACSKWPIVPL